MNEEKDMPIPRVEDPDVETQPEGRFERGSYEQVINRHIARLMDELEEAACPTIFRHAVRHRLQQLRTDLVECRDHQPGDRLIPS